MNSLLNRTHWFWMKKNSIIISLLPFPDESNTCWLLKLPNKNAKKSHVISVLFHKQAHQTMGNIKVPLLSYTRCKHWPQRKKYKSDKVWKTLMFTVTEKYYIQNNVDMSPSEPNRCRMNWSRVLVLIRCAYFVLVTVDSLCTIISCGK